MGYLTQSSLNLCVQIYSENFSGLKLSKRTEEEGIHHRLSSSVLYLAWGRWGPHLVGVQQRVLGGVRLRDASLACRLHTGAGVRTAAQHRVPFCLESCACISRLCDFLLHSNLYSYPLKKPSPPGWPGGWPFR